MKAAISSIVVGILLASGANALVGEDSDGTGLTPMPSPRGEALRAIEMDRDGVIIDLATDVAEADRPDYLLYLDQLENHELIDLMVGDGPLETRGFATLGDFKDMVYSALDAPCRILDTRKYDSPLVFTGSQQYIIPPIIMPPIIFPPISSPIAAGKAREVFDYGIGWQGGDEACAADLAGKDALVVSLSAISPTFPANFPATGYGTLLNGAEMAEAGWSPTDSLEITSREWYQYEYSPAPYTKAVTVTWDANTSLISAFAIVTRQVAKPDVVLYSRGNAHYTIDVVGYLDDPQRCPFLSTLIDGLCWGFEFGPTDWYTANEDCSGAGGRLPSAGAISGAVKDGKFTPSANLFADAYFYYDSLYYKQQITSAGQAALTTANAKYRCVWTPLIVP
jgi:hypothetical protein